MPNRYCCYTINMFYLIWVGIGWSCTLDFNFNMALSRNNYILNCVVYNGFAYFHNFKNHVTNQNILKCVYFLLNYVYYVLQSIIRKICTCIVYSNYNINFFKIVNFFNVFL